MEFRQIKKDIVYLASRGVASIDLDEVNIKKLSMTTVKKLSRRFPGYTQNYLKKII